MLVKEKERKKENDLHKSIIHRESSSAVMLAARLYGSILTAPADSPHLIKCCCRLTFHAKKDRLRLTQTFFFPPLSLSSGRFEVKILTFNFAPASVSRCHLRWLKETAPSDPFDSRGSSRRGDSGGQALEERRQPRRSLSLLCNNHQSAAVPGAAGPHKCPSLTLTPAFTIAVDVMTQNKERGGASPLCEEGVLPRRRGEEGYHPTDAVASSLGSQLLTGT